MAKELAVLQDGKTDPCLIPRFLFQAFPCGVPSSLGPPVSSFSRHVQNIVHKYSMSKLPCYHCDGLICPRYFLDEEKKSVNIHSPVCRSSICALCQKDMGSPIAFKNVTYNDQM